MKYYIIAGEASGDLHGSNLVREIKKLDPAAGFRGWGGDKMKEQGVEIVRHYRDTAYMGFAEVIMNLRSILRNLEFCKKDILQFQPDTLILVDYPGFNLRIAKWARNTSQFKGRIIYYISPQVWAWKENRVKSMKLSIDKMLVILPFEKAYYREKWNWDVEYVGHPLIEEIQMAGRGEKEVEKRKGIIALIPGSRKQEIIKKLPIMLGASRSFPGHHFIVAKAPAMEDKLYEELMRGYENVEAVSGQTYSILSKADAALVTSGTATLETALLGVPQVVCYKGSWLSYQLGKRLVNVKYISLVNLIMNKPIVTELIQNKLTVSNLVKELTSILTDPAKREEIKKEYAGLRSLLGQEGNASAKAAAAIVRSGQ